MANTTTKAARELAKATIKIRRTDRELADRLARAINDELERYRRDRGE